MRALVVVNPVAGAGRGARVWRHLRGSAADLEWVQTERPGHARELARQAVDAGYERVIAIGGDGTLSEVAGGIAHSRTALAIVPAGTGNDFASTVGVPRDPRAALQLAVAGAARPVDLGDVRTAQTRTYFANVGGFGFDADVVARLSAPRRAGAPLRWAPKSTRAVLGGRVPYVRGVLLTLRRLQSSHVRLTIDDRQLEREVFAVAVANGPRYAGGMRIAPGASIDDGFFDVCIIGKLSRVEVLRLLPLMYFGGHRGHPGVELVRGRRVRAEAHAGVRCQADGELVGTLPATFELHPGGIRCVVGAA